MREALLWIKCDELSAQIFDDARRRAIDWLIVPLRSIRELETIEDWSESVKDLTALPSGQMLAVARQSILRAFSPCESDYYSIDSIQHVESGVMAYSYHLSKASQVEQAITKDWLSDSDSFHDVALSKGKTQIGERLWNQHKRESSEAPQFSSSPLFEDCSVELMPVFDDGSDCLALFTDGGCRGDSLPAIASREAGMFGLKSIVDLHTAKRIIGQVADYSLLNLTALLLPQDLTSGDQGAEHGAC